MNGGFHVLQLLHQRFVDVQAAGGIDDQHVLAVVAGVIHRFLGGFHGVLGALFKHRHPHLLAHHLQLLDSGGVVNIAGGQQGLFALLDQETGQLGGHGGFAGALQAAEHIDRGHGGGPGELGVAAAHQSGQLLVHDLDHLLPGVQVGEYLRADAAFGDLFDEIIHHQVVHVGFQQGHADLAHGVLDVLLGQLAFPGELFKGVLQLFGKPFKGHYSSS